MQRIKTLVAIAAAALMAMAAFSAVSASAGTVLCSEAVTTCAQTDIKPSGTQFVTGAIDYGKAGIQIKPSVLSGEGIRCSDDLMVVKSTMRNGNPLPGEFQGTVTASKCKAAWIAPNSCSSVATNQPPATLTATSGGNGTVSIGSSAEPLTISLTCDFLDTGVSTCSYKATSAVTMTIEEAAVGTVKAAPLVKTAGSSFACLGSSATLNVDNLINGESPHIAQATETVLCGQGWSVCPNSQILPAGNSVITGYLQEGQGFKLTGTGIYKNYVSCGNFGLRFDTTQQSGAPLGGKTAYSSVPSGACKAAVFFGGETCSSVAVNAPPVSIEATAENKGTIQVGTAAQPLKITFTCSLLGYQSTCEYAGTGPVPMQIEYMENTSAVKAAPLVRTQGEGEVFCPATANLDLNATVAAEAAVISSI